MAGDDRGRIRGPGVGPASQPAAPGSGKRRSRRARASPQAVRGEAYRSLESPFQPLEVLSEDALDRIHLAALSILSDAGLRVLSAEAVDIILSQGLGEDHGGIMRFDPDAVEDAVAKAPSRFTISSRDGNRDVEMGGPSVALLPVAGPPHAMDLERGRRAGTLADFLDFTRLTQAYDVLAALTPAVEPQDVPIQERHLEMTLGQLELSDKVPFVYSRGRSQVADCLEMIAAASGGEGSLASAPRCWTVINTNSPRQLDVAMCEGIIDFARNGQVLVITPFTLAGAMAPVTLAGALTLQHAEALAAIALAQVVGPGTPVVYGGFTSNVDMRSGAPAFGTPEAFKAALASGQLARRQGLPWRSSGVSTSNAPDAQSAYETMINTYGALLGGANMIVHAAGWLESGLSASFEKFILDVEMAQILAESLQPLGAGAEELAIEAIAEVEPGGHFFGSPHTLERYREAFYEPIVFDRSNFEQWTEAGSPDAARRAHRVYKEVLSEFEPPSLDPAVRDELGSFVERRKAEGGAVPTGT